MNDVCTSAGVMAGEEGGLHRCVGSSAGRGHICNQYYVNFVLYDAACGARA